MSHPMKSRTAARPRHTAARPSQGGGTTLALFLAFALFAALASCVGPSFVEMPSGVRDLHEKVLDRHDKYVEADPTLLELERTTYLRSSTLLREWAAENK